jgi:hypothetical protein
MLKNTSRMRFPATAEVKFELLARIYSTNDIIYRAPHWAQGHGPGPWPGAVAQGIGPGPWPRAMAQGRGPRWSGLRATAAAEAAAAPPPQPYPQQKN